MINKWQYNKQLSNGKKSVSNTRGGIINLHWLNSPIPASQLSNPTGMLTKLRRVSQTAIRKMKAISIGHTHISSNQNTTHHKRKENTFISNNNRFNNRG